MTGEPIRPERDRFSFEELGRIIDAYEDAFYAHNAACFVNQAYDEKGFATIGGQDLANWKQEFPRTDDVEAARLESALEAAKEQTVSVLGLESPDVIPGLREAWHNEETRQQLESSLGPDKTDPWRHAIAVKSSSLTPSDMIAGAIAMSKLTGETYVMHGGIVRDSTYNYLYVTVGPAHEADDVVAQFAEHGLA